MDYKPLLAQLITERDRLDCAISALQALDQEQLPVLVAGALRIRARGRPPGSHNKPKVALQDSNGLLRESAEELPQARIILPENSIFSK
jgi:hypothetical protein